MGEEGEGILKMNHFMNVKKDERAQIELQRQLNILMDTIFSTNPNNYKTFETLCKKGFPY